ncbi:MAG: acyl-CoA thioesterase [Trueperaceae bacterium]
MKNYFEHTRIVQETDLDELEHVNNAVYLIYIEAVAREHALREGLGLDEFKAHGVIPVVRSHAITYYKPAQRNDTLLISTKVKDIGGAKALRHNEVRHADTKELLASAITEWGWLDTKTNRPRRVPEAIRAAFGF